jgi:hypothetical protein
MPPLARRPTSDEDSGSARGPLLALTRAPALRALNDRGALRARGGDGVCDMRWGVHA